MRQKNDQEKQNEMRQKCIQKYHRVHSLLATYSRAWGLPYSAVNIHSENSLEKTSVCWHLSIADST